jgi:hypothetical protein
MISSARTITSQQRDEYNSFSTYVEHKGSLFLYYCKANTNTNSCHGIDGRVRCFQIGTKTLKDGSISNTLVINEANHLLNLVLA